MADRKSKPAEQPDETAAEQRTDKALDRERHVRNADRTDDEQRQAVEAEQKRAVTRGEDQNDTDRREQPAERGVSEDDGGPEDEPDQERVLARIAEAQGTTPDELRERLTRERGTDPDLPLVSHVEAFETGYAGQVPDTVPNEAYTVSGQVTGEAAAQDRRAATRGRLDDTGLTERTARRAGGRGRTTDG
jgi:hypothetical protein